MPDRAYRDPAYRKHKQSGQAIVTLPDGFGGRRDFMLGKYGSKESRIEYRRRLAEWEAAGRRLPSKEVLGDRVVNEIVLAYVEHVERTYRKDGKPTETLDNVKDAMRPLVRLYGDTLGKDFGPRALKTVQQQMVTDGLCRNTINRRVGRIKTLFRWAESEELVPPSTRHALETVSGLARGRSDARETEPVRPVAAATVEATLPHLRPAVADMVRVQQLTGMRSGELVIMRTIDLDTSGAVWLYRPGSDRAHGEHKTAHHGHQRVVAIGPKAQAILRHYLRADLYAPLFQPGEVVLSMREQQRAARKSKVQPSQMDRKKHKTKRKPGDRYTVGTYRQAVERGCLKAGVSWFPHQLRHSRATEIRRTFGLDAARATLGHRSPAITETYAELDEQKAVEVAAKLG